MRSSVTLAAAVLLLMTAGTAQAQESEIETLRSAVEEMRADYDARIAELEKRLAVAEQNAEQAKYATQQTAVMQADVSSGNSGPAAFNPAIGVIFQGQAWNFSKNPDDYAIQGFPFGGEAGPIDEGLGIGETELILNANVDDKFSAWLTAALALEDGEIGRARKHGSRRWHFRPGSVRNSVVSFRESAI